MPLIISMLLTVGVIFWFYKTAERLGSKSVHWAAAGAIAYQVPAWAWMLLVSKPYLQSLRGATKTGMTAMLIGHSWILVGIVAVLIVYKFFLLKTNVKAEDGTLLFGYGRSGEYWHPPSSPLPAQSHRCILLQSRESPPA